MAASAKPISTYTIPLGTHAHNSKDSSDTAAIVIHNPDLRSENLHLTTWGSAHVLAQALHRIDLDPSVFDEDEDEDGDEGKTKAGAGESRTGTGTGTGNGNGQKEKIHILELGAGTGLVGLSAAAVWADRGANVLLTDLPGIVPGLAVNIAANTSTALAHTQGHDRDQDQDHDHDVKQRDDGKKRTNQVYCATLDWRKPEELIFYPPAPTSTCGTSCTFPSPSSTHGTDDKPRPKAGPPAVNKVPIIIVADCIYDPDHPEMLVDVIFARLLGSDNRPDPDKRQAEEEREQRGRKQARLIVAYPLRVAYLDAIRDLWERLERGGLECVQTDRAHAPDEFEDESLIEWAVFGWASRK